MYKQLSCQCNGAALAAVQIMVHRILCMTLMMMCGVTTATGQYLHDDRTLRERAMRLEPYIVAAAKRYGVDARILRVICFVESRYRINAVSPKGARGPMQFMPATAARYGLRNPHDPEQAIEAVARYLRDLLERFDGRVDLAVAAYNAGEGTVSSYMTGKPFVLREGGIVNDRGVVTGGIPPYQETQRYVRSILGLLRADATASVKNQYSRFRVDSRKNFFVDVFDEGQPIRKDQKKCSFTLHRSTVRRALISVRLLPSIPAVACRSQNGTLLVSTI